ncbi:MAG: potassium-transporting ATPase subunit KdpC [Candidatus Accumulibacter sp.]|jgi:K+-transporting ATPase ATPase C chain|uniref:potassium-transporting ATPase subunit KdpC n=1 Tax=Accumulibacter sp. TaxID=2053492 RepID=UPI001A44F28A|nr:potassium-transporting ATPase subunit KdpC [Accumulibacter sp.]MBL8394314.1 potassium-transporting ATPase subunit KdpC [Accumulibacter sp.]
MKTLLRPAVSLFVLLSLLCGVAYPLLVTGMARLAFPFAAQGSLIIRDGRPIGSVLIGQNFTDPKYFWGRPSATTPQPYNAAASSGSNLGPTNPALVDAIKARIEALRAADPTNQRAVPIDLVTASASGLDPHISPAAADYQTERVARARQLDPQTVRQLIARHSEGRDLGLFGEPRVHVLKLNLALDATTR